MDCDEVWSIMFDRVVPCPRDPLIRNIGTIRAILGLYWGNIRVILGLYIQDLLGLHWGYILGLY